MIAVFGRWKSWWIEFGGSSMASYREIQDYIRAQNGFVPKTCWIAHVKADYGLTNGDAPNRANPSERQHLCPDNKRVAIESALRHFKMIRTK